MAARRGRSTVAATIPPWPACPNTKNALACVHECTSFCMDRWPISHPGALSPAQFMFSPQGVNVGVPLSAPLESPWALCPNTKGALASYHTCTEYCKDRWKSVQPQAPAKPAPANPFQGGPSLLPQGQSRLAAATLNPMHQVCICYIRIN
jgi:hypothetical protein